MYRKFFKRFFDVLLSGCALILLSPVLLIVALGYLLKRRGVFQQGDARLLSRIIVNLTLPGALLSSFSAFIWRR